jgi:hypothetical protein
LKRAYDDSLFEIGEKYPGTKAADEASELEVSAGGYRLLDRAACTGVTAPNRGIVLGEDHIHVPNPDHLVVADHSGDPVPPLFRRPGCPGVIT